MRDLERTLGDFIDRQSVCFITVTTDTGYPATKAFLPPARREGMRAFYFHTNTSSQKAAQYRKNHKTCLYFCEEKSFLGRSLTGDMAVLTDAASKESLWKPGYELYYPGGVTDGDYCVLKFTARAGRLYGGDFTSTDFIPA
jgi:general stress protein 26